MTHLTQRDINIIILIIYPCVSLDTCVSFFRHNRGSCQRVSVSAFFPTKQTHTNTISMLLIKGHRPLDSKSIAHYAKILVNKGNTMALKMGVATLLTEKR